MNSSNSNNIPGQGKGQASSTEPHPRDGHLRIPNQVVDRLAQLRASGGEWQIVLATWRRTLGWQHSGEWRNKPYPISLGDLSRATGLDRRHVARQVKDLVQRNILRRIPGEQKYLLCFNLDYSTWVVSKQSPVAKRPLGGGETATNPSGRTATDLVAKRSLSSNTTSDRPKETIKKQINKHTKETGTGGKLPLRTSIKSKPYQVEAGMFLGLVEQREGIKIINRAKAIKAIRSISLKYPNATSEKLYECFTWLGENDSFLYKKEPPLIISMMPDKYPAWLTGRLEPRGEGNGKPPRGVRPKPNQERRRPITRISGNQDPEGEKDLP